MLDTSAIAPELAHDRSRHNIPVKQRTSAEFDVPRLWESDRGSPWPARLGVCDQFCQWSRAGLALEICGKVMRLAESDFMHVSASPTRS
jgi:hypothetical protein